MQRLDTHRWAGETLEILGRAVQALLESKQGGVRDLANHLPDPDGEQERPITLAFAGQYSAGKSTLLRALTGLENIAIGAGITTEETRTLDWNGVHVVDTPGIHTSLRPDHDTISYEAISKADLLVFAITNELFDSHLGEHFRKLTIDREKGHETILVVNKMDRTADGNTPETQETITDALREPLAPFTPEDLSITFTAAQRALEADREEDDEIAGMLREDGNIENLVLNLNNLISKKGLTARHTTTLYAVDQMVQEAMTLEPPGDTDVDNLMVVYEQNLRVMDETRSQLRESTNNAILESMQQIDRVGEKYADTVRPGMTEEEMERGAEEVDANLQSIWEELVNRIFQECSEGLPTMASRLEELHDSHRFQSTLGNLNAKASGPDVSRILTMARDAARGLSELSRIAARNSSAVASGSTGLSGFSGGVAHKAALNIGRFMGHSFKPWDAVKIARGIGTAGTVLNIASSVLSVYLQIREDREEARISEETMRARKELTAHFASVAQSVQDEANGVVEGLIREALTEPMEEIREYSDELNRARQDQNTHIEHLAEVSKSARELIARIHEGHQQATNSI